jgi:hypothetical protein
MLISLFERSRKAPTSTSCSRIETSRVAFQKSPVVRNITRLSSGREAPLHQRRKADRANLGRIEEAKLMAQRLLEVQPQFTIASITSAPFANPEILAALGHALRRVGLPE